jgi:hypothetical protein
VQVRNHDVFLRGSRLTQRRFAIEYPGSTLGGQRLIEKHRVSTEVPGHITLQRIAAGIPIGVVVIGLLAARTGSYHHCLFAWFIYWVRPAHRDHLLTAPRPEEWLLIEWPQDDVPPRCSRDLPFPMVIDPEVPG